MRLLFILCLMLFGASAVVAQSPSRSETLNISSGTVMEFVEGEYTIAAGKDLPETGWERDTNPNIDHRNKTQQPMGDYRTMAGRFFFNREDIGTGATAIYLIGMRGNFSVSVNNEEVFQNFLDESDRKNSWYRPFLITVPDEALAPGLNEIVIHSFSRKSIGIGRVLIGAHTALQDRYEKQYFWNITAPMVANFTMLLLGALVFMFWLARKHEIELLWLSIAAILWFTRNHQYYVENLPLSISLYTAITLYSTYFSVVASAAFYFCFIKLPYRNRIIAVMFLAGIPLVVLHEIFGFATTLLYVPSAVVTSMVALVGLNDLVRNRNFERGVLGLGILLLPVAGLYDLVMLLSHSGEGHATYLAVFCGLIFAVTFLISFGKRVLDAFSGLEKSNLILEQRVAETRAELADSEAIRQELLVTQALASERGRLMQEMHDGIGSNLTTALAVARQQNQPNSTVKVLRRALGDLKLTVDSLEPVEGDLVALIGNLRHRMARDLADAGITCTWEVELCELIPWLDATNALHVLRIHNEAISNVLAHSNATEMRIGCVESRQDGVAGISTYVADNGTGFDMNLETTGKGLANMKARAHSLHGQLLCDSKPHGGTTITLWLPYVRRTPKAVHC
ncbi:MAG: sensor histidine kinase [Octadecabacter sp.]